MAYPISQEAYRFFMAKALSEAEAALNRGEFPVGCVIVDRQDVVAKGSREGSSGRHPNEIDHAEIIALRSIFQLEMEIDLSGLALFCTLEPCLMCYGAILLSGIAQIIYAYEDIMGGGTHCNLALMPPFYAKRKPAITAGVMRKESLELFQAFFRNPKNGYWRHSPLADYTLQQSLGGPDRT